MSWTTRSSSRAARRSWASFQTHQHRCFGLSRWTFFPKHAPERAAGIDSAIGDGSRFHEAFDYYAPGIGPETIVAPAGWEGRLIRLELLAVARKSRTAVAWCLEVHDLVLAKLAAGRPHDLGFAQDALAEGLVNLERLRLGIDLMPSRHRERTRTRLEGIRRKARS